MKQTIAIIGAGFSGTVIAARLLRANAVVPLHVVLINRAMTDQKSAAGAADNLARGLAYGTKSDDHLLNVPAGRMSAFPEDENDFLNFIIRRGLSADLPVTGGSFVPRRWYGEYLREILDHASAHPANKNTFEILSGEVIALEKNAGCATLKFSDDRIYKADKVVLALGNFAPTNPESVSQSAADSPFYICDPWAPGALNHIDNRIDNRIDKNTDKPILLIGTSLTMFDLVLTLNKRFPHAKFIAISRRGLLPQPHREGGAAPRFDHAPEHILEGAATTRAYVRHVRIAIARDHKNGGDWREVIASLRPITPALWQRLDTDERARFLRHVRPYWESHRHRAAPEIAKAINRLIASQHLKTIAARLINIEVASPSSGPGLQVEFRPRKQAAAELLVARAVINCTGPSSDYRAAKEALLLNLEAQGFVRQDAARLGIATNERLQILAQDGSAQTNLFCVGPLLKADFWEATAVPELRVHARVAVDVLLSTIQP